MMNYSTWENYSKVSFEVEGNTGFLIIPKNPKEGNPWVWRAEFFGAFDFADRALLDKGWFIAYYSVSDMYGSPEAVALMKKFHDYVVREFELHNKAEMFGFSRGGLYAVNYAINHPSDVSVLYLDAPVIDLASWPGMLYSTAPYRERYKNDREGCIKLFGLKDESGLDSLKENPKNKIDELIKVKIPAIIVSGDSDKTVDYNENGELITKAYQKAGLPFECIIKKDCDHHPHSLENPKHIIDFIIKYHS